MLTVSTKVRYAVRLMAYLAAQPANTVVSVREIAAAEKISAEYLEQILLQLKSAQLVTSRRGARGGFALAQAPEAITLADIYSAIEGSLELVPCVDKECTQSVSCVATSAWQEANEALLVVFRRTTLASLHDTPSREEDAVYHDFHI